MQYLSSNSWLQWAVQLEDEVDCDVAAGLDFGQNLPKYLAKTQAHNCCWKNHLYKELTVKKNISSLRDAPRT
ncbi:hypothetical protein [uncultured Nostoc sp.]|uniref:hypothetical protein n=1 Tax=uncultured Nostoc sp. TaxID=340711 RepID=UPI0035CA320A